MESVIIEFLKAIATGGTEALAVAGWALFVLERFFISRALERRHREDLKQIRDDYERLSENTIETIQKFMSILEVLKDRGDR